MIDRQQSIRQSRLGLILLKKAYISQAQLLKALGYQTRRKIKLGTALIELKLISCDQLNSALRRQSWTRTITTCIALFCAPFCATVSAENTPKTKIVQLKSNPSISDKNNDPNNYFNNGFRVSKHFEKQAKQFYFTDQNQLGFSFSQSSGIQLSLYTAQYNDYQNPVFYEFEPQISLFKSSSRRTHLSQTHKRISDRINHYSKPIPVVYMLSLKGRSIAESAGNKTTMWSLNTAKNGVQPKAELMFSITKQF